MIEDSELQLVRQHCLNTRNNREQQVPDSIHRLPKGGYIVHFIGKDQQLTEIVRYERDLRVHSVISFNVREPELAAVRKDRDLMWGVVLWALMLLSSALIGYCWVMYNAWGKR